MAMAQTGLVLCTALLIATSGCKEPNEGGSKSEVEIAPIAEALPPKTASEIEPKPQQPTSSAPDKNPEIAAYFFEGVQVYRVSAASPRKPVTLFSGLRFCITDPEHKALWLLGSEGLAVYDLTEQTQTLVVKTAADNPIDTFEVRFGDGKGRVGNAHALEDMAALVLMLTPNDVSLRSETLCDGDLAHTCFLEEGDDPELWQPVPELKAILARYGAMGVQEASKKIIEAIALRKSEPSVPADSSLELPKETPKTGISKRNCIEEPDDCGTGEFLGFGFWSIVSANSRGDFYHETSSLYDAKRGTWVNPNTGLLVKSPSNAAFELAALAPDHSSLLTAEGSWFSLQERKVKLKLDGDNAFCGFGQ